MESNFSTPQIIDDYSISDLSVNSILVIEEPHTLIESTRPQVNKEEQNEIIMNNLKAKLNETLAENNLLKSQCGYLSNKLEESASKLDDRESSDKSIHAYFDIGEVNLSNKIEKYFKETNQMFKNKETLFDAMEYLIKNVWSLIAHEYCEESLDNLKKTKDDLISKLNKARLENDSNTTSDYQIHSLSDELDSFKTDAEILKEKVSTQNEIIKSFISQMDSLKSFTLISNQNQNEIKNSIELKSESENLKSESPTNDIPSTSNEAEELIEEENSFSPGSSPTSFFINRFQKKIDSKQTPSVSQIKASNDFYLYNVNEDYIGVDKSLENSTLIHTDLNLENIFTCSNCKTSIDKSAIDQKRIDQHVFKCNVENNKDCRLYFVCMFCLELFEKCVQNEYENHVRSHISLNVEDT